METVKQDKPVIEPLKGLPLEAKPEMLIPALRTTFGKLSEIIMDLSREVAQTNKDHLKKNNDLAKSLSLVEETLKNFGTRLDALQEKVDSAVSASKITSACGPVIVNVNSVKELEERIKTLNVGDYRVHFKELSGLHLYVGDDHALLLYPDFYDMELPGYSVNHMKCSKFKWTETKTGIIYGWGA